MTGVARSSYREWAPPAELAPWVECLWCQDIAPGDDAYDQRVLPDGCIDLLLLPDRRVLVAGPATEAVVTPIPSASRTLGIRFRPGVAGSALGIPASEVLDTDVPIEDAIPDWPQNDDSLVATLVERVRPRTADHLVVEAVRRLHTGEARVKDLPPDLGVGERQLRRRFHDAVGYAPKTLDRVLRLQRFLRLAEQPDGPAPDLAQAAALSGYADQPHLARDCRHLAGLTPAELLASRASA